MLNFKVEANTQAAPRQTLVELQTNGATLETILIFQEGEYDPATMVLRVEAAPPRARTPNIRTWSTCRSTAP